MKTVLFSALTACVFALGCAEPKADTAPVVEVTVKFRSSVDDATNITLSSEDVRLFKALTAECNGKTRLQGPIPSMPLIGRLSVYRKSDGVLLREITIFDHWKNYQEAGIHYEGDLTKTREFIVAYLKRNAESVEH